MQMLCACVKRFACSVHDGANIHINSSLYSIRCMLTSMCSPTYTAFSTADSIKIRSALGHNYVYYSYMNDYIKKKNVYAYLRLTSPFLLPHKSITLYAKCPL